MENVKRERIQLVTFVSVGVLAIAAAVITGHPGWIAASLVAVLGLVVVLRRRAGRARDASEPGV